MKKLMLVVMAVFYLSGCAIAPKADAVRTAADRSEYKGLDENTKFSVSLPSLHSGPYESIEQLNFRIDEGEYKDKNASAIIGKSRSAGIWEVLMIMVDENGRWIKLPRR